MPRKIHKKKALIKFGISKSIVNDWIKNESKFLNDLSIDLNKTLFIKEIKYYYQYM